MIAKKISKQCHFGKQEIVFTSLPEEGQGLILDLTNPMEFDYSAISEADTVIHLAAISSPDACENAYADAYQINVAGTIRFVENCLKRNARVLFFSSDTVYGESKDISEPVFTEESACQPKGKYAEMKHAVEKVFALESRFKVFRLSYVFSKNDKFTVYLIKCAEQKKAAEIYHPFYRNVIYVDDIINAIQSLLNNWDLHTNQVFNLCGRQLLSRQEMAAQYKKIVNSNLNFKVIEPSSGFFKARARIIKTASLHLNKLLLKDTMNIDQALKQEFKEEIKCRQKRR